MTVPKTIRSTLLIMQGKLESPGFKSSPYKSALCESLKTWDQFLKLWKEKTKPKTWGLPTIEFCQITESIPRSRRIDYKFEGDKPIRWRQKSFPYSCTLPPTFLLSFSLPYFLRFQELDNYLGKKMNLNRDSCQRKINWKWIIDRNVKGKIIKLQ